jgi:hypothetical protein
MRTFSLLLVLALACGDDDVPTVDAGRDAGESLDAAETFDANDPLDAEPRDANAPLDADEARDANAPLDAETVADAGRIACDFNRECPEDSFCDSDACDEGCFCAVGPRGTGELGDACVSGNECASSICLEGPGDVLMCSVECEDDGDCAAPLPRCIALGICARMPPG